MYVEWFTNFSGLQFNEEMVLFCSKRMNSVLSEFFLLPALGYAIDIRLEKVYLRKALDHLHSLHPWQFLRNIACFFFYLFIDLF